MLNDRVMVKPSADDKTPSGIIIPDSAKDRGRMGVVIAVGPGRKTDSGTHVPLDVHVGDPVLYGGYAGSTITLEGGEYVILREDEILAVIE
jgi:chaperonin GroES